MIKRRTYVTLGLFLVRAGLLVGLAYSSELSPIASFGILPLLFLDIMFFTGRTLEKISDEDFSRNGDDRNPGAAEYFYSPSTVAELERYLFEEDDITKAA